MQHPQGGKRGDDQASAQGRSAEPPDDRRHVFFEHERLPTSQDRDGSAVVGRGCNQEGSGRHGDEAAFRIVQKQEAAQPFYA